MSEAEVRDLLAICEAADDQDTGSLDAFRAAATVGVVAALCDSWLAQREALQYIAERPAASFSGRAAGIAKEALAAGGETETP